MIIVADKCKPRFDFTSFVSITIAVFCTRFPVLVLHTTLITMGSSSNKPVDLNHALSLFTDHWSPKNVASINDYDIKVAKVSNSFKWHSHKDTEQLFMVLSGTLIIQLRPEDGGDVVLGPNQLFVVPKGVEHCPRTEEGEEARILLIDPKEEVSNTAKDHD